jgi:hypothetical protein
MDTWAGLRGIILGIDWKYKCWRIEFGFEVAYFL